MGSRNRLLLQWVVGGGGRLGGGTSVLATTTATSRMQSSLRALPGTATTTMPMVFTQRHHPKQRQQQRHTFSIMMNRSVAATTTTTPTTTKCSSRFLSVHPSLNGSAVLWRHPNHHRPNATAASVRHYTPLTAEEEEREKERLTTLTPFARDQELRALNRDISRLEKLRGMNTGELYTWSGRYKALARDYGMPLVAYYWAVWMSSAVLCYGSITVLNVDALALLAQVDAKLGWDLVSKVDPEMGKIGLSLIVNELLEPIRLPAVIVTVKPVIDKLYPPKY